MTGRSHMRVRGAYTRLGVPVERLRRFDSVQIPSRLLLHTALSPSNRMLCPLVPGMSAKSGRERKNQNPSTCRIQARFTVITDRGDDGGAARRAVVGVRRHLNPHARTGGGGQSYPYPDRMRGRRLRCLRAAEQTSARRERNAAVPQA